MGELLKIKAFTLKDQVADTLRKSGIDGTLAPGARLIERELCAQMGVSRPSVREALRQLESEGLVSNVPNRGPIVAPVSRAVAKDVYEVRQSLEGLAARLFARSASDEEMAAIVLCNAELQKLSRKASSETYLEIKDRFYSILLAGSGNEMLMQVGGMALRRFRQLRNISVAKTGRGEESRKEIAALIQALVARDEKRAERACTLHVQNTGKAVLDALKKMESS